MLDRGLSTALKRAMITHAAVHALGLQINTSTLIICCVDMHRPVCRAVTPYSPGLQAVTGIQGPPGVAAHQSRAPAGGHAAARKSRKSSIWPETDISVRKSFSFAHKG